MFVLLPLHKQSGSAMGLLVFASALEQNKSLRVRQKVLHGASGSGGAKPSSTSSTSCTTSPPNPLRSLSLSGLLGLPSCRCLLGTSTDYVCIGLAPTLAWSWGSQTCHMAHLWHPVAVVPLWLSPQDWDLNHLGCPRSRMFLAMWHRRCHQIMYDGEYG